MKTKITFRDSELSTKVGIIDLHLTRWTFCIANMTENYFDSYGCPSLKKLIKFKNNRNEKRVIWEYNNQEKDS